MKGTEVYGVLKAIGATELHHANSVTTSCTFLEQGGLLSRGFVEDHHLKQTAQPSSDEIDKKYGIWHRIFLDHVDIHDRAGRKKGPNYYGPVLFVFDLDILLGLPANTEVSVTKKNPVHWHDDQADGERWYESAEELAKDIHFGNFDKMLVIQTPSGKLDFSKSRARTLLDDPQREMLGEGAYIRAEKRLKAAAATGKVEISIQRRLCQSGCTCLEKYAKYSTEKLNLLFG